MSRPILPPRSRGAAGLLLWAALCGWQPPLLAAGTVAGTDVENSATVEYSLGERRSRLTSNSATFRVGRLLDAKLTWQDAANVTVRSPDSRRLLTFVLTNTGNGEDRYILQVDSGTGTDPFDPDHVEIYLDADGDGALDPEVDRLYVPGVHEPELAADGSRTLFVRADIPAGLEDGDTGRIRLTAASASGSGAPGTVVSVDGGVTAVVGASGARDAATGVYQVGDSGLSLRKSVAIEDPLGGRRPMPGATLAYTIEVSVPAPGTAADVVITDPVPADTRYVPGTLSLNGAPLTDEADGDAGDVGGTAADTVTVRLGDLDADTPVQTIRFEVIIH